MNCPYCAEQIQNEAVLCRFCGATRDGESWQAAPREQLPRKAPGTLNFRVAGALFLASAVFEVFSVTSPVPLLGAVRTGFIAVLYHLVFIGLFAWVGMGLWRARPWGLRAILVTTAVYSLERAVYLLGGSASQGELTRMLRTFVGPEEAKQLTELANQVTVLITVTVLLCWWGFAGYAWWRRAYFCER